MQIKFALNLFVLITSQAIASNTKESCAIFIEYLTRFEEARDTFVFHGTTLHTLDIAMRNNKIPAGIDGHLFFAPNPHSGELKKMLESGQLDALMYKKSIDDFQNTPGYNVIDAMETAEPYSNIQAQRYYIAEKLGIEDLNEERARLIDEVIVFYEPASTLPGKASEVTKRSVVAQARKQKGIIIGFDENLAREQKIITATELRLKEAKGKAKDLAYGDEGIAIESSDGINLNHITAVWVPNLEVKKQVVEKFRAKGIYVPVYLRTK